MQASVTIVVKTFERPKSLKNLLQSISKLGLKYPILVADDSRISLEREIKSEFSDLEITWLSLPFDTGLSEGRNILVNAVKSPYFLLCDDDFVFDERADIQKALRCLEENKLSVLGGDFYNYVTIPNIKRFIKLILTDPVKVKMFMLKEYSTSRYLGVFKESADGACELLITNNKPSQLPYYCDLVNNFFLAKTDAIKKMGGWDPQLKLGEHEDFFFRAKKAGLAVAYLPDFGIGHYPVIRSNYKKYRLRAQEFKRMFVKKHAFKSYSEVQTDTNEVLFKI